MIVDFILLFIFEKVDFNKDFYIILLYRHILTSKSMNEYINILNFYIINAERLIMNLKNSVKSFFASGIKSCLTCRDFLRNLNRYSRIVRRTLIDKTIKKFIV